MIADSTRRVCIFEDSIQNAKILFFASYIFEDSIQNAKILFFASCIFEDSIQNARSERKNDSGLSFFLPRSRPVINPALGRHRSIGRAGALPTP